MSVRNFSKDILFGLSVGDALGVPYEFKDRDSLLQNPVTEMEGYGTFNLPPGTFSDDSSLAFCLAEALTQEYSLKRIADNFVLWLRDNYWTADNKVFDVGIGTSHAIRRIETGVPPELAGGFDISDNGNGSLMRILPLVLYIRRKPISERYQITKEVSSITHGHIRSVISCFYYLEFARLIIEGESKFTIYKKLKLEISEFLTTLSINPEEINLFKRLLVEDIYKFNEEEINSSGYVLHTLEASIWSLLITDNYRAATLKSVNLGHDTDTTSSVTGGLAALLYGWQSIPENWLNQLARKDDIDDLANRMNLSAVNIA